MPRTITPAMLSTIRSGLVNCAFLVSLEFKSSPAYLWTGFGDLVWNAFTWKGAGSILSTSPLVEGSTVEARGITLTLSGIDTTILPMVLSDYKLGGAVSVYLAAFYSSGTPGTIVPDPILAWAGRLDHPNVKISGQTASIEIACETRLLDMNISVERRRTNDDQTQLVPGDDGFRFVAGLQEAAITWGTATTKSSNF